MIVLNRNMEWLNIDVTPEQFIKKWKSSTLTERAASQSHFIDLCALLDEPTPTDVDPTGENYAFERGANKTTGGEGWADVWKRGCFAWEYKGKRKDLKAAYAQLQQYAVAWKTRRSLSSATWRRSRSTPTGRTPSTRCTGSASRSCARRTTAPAESRFQRP